jgi:putative endonuclease
MGGYGAVNRKAFGDVGETLVAEALVRDGYVIRARNVHCRRGEIDIVAEKGALLCFVEVRMRSNATWGDPAVSVHRGKQLKVIYSAMEYVQKHRLGNRMIRFDVASVLGQGRSAVVELIPNAFEAF